MAGINVDVDALVAFANKTDVFQSEVSAICAKLNTSFESLSVQWHDQQYLNYGQVQLQPIIEHVMIMDSLLEKELKPFLADYYQRIREYQMG